MKLPVKTKIPLLVLSDIVVFYISLLLALFIRYRSWNTDIIAAHLPPFTVAFFVWLIISYIGGLYEDQLLKNTPEFRKSFFGVLASQAILMIAVFYFLPSVGIAPEIAPKITLFIFLGVFAILTYSWRVAIHTLLASGAPQERILIIGSNRSTDELVSHLQHNPQLGYEISFWMQGGLQDTSAEELSTLIRDKHISLIVLPAHIKKNNRSAKIVYQSLIRGTRVVHLSDFYETIFKKVSISELEESWVFEHLAAPRGPYESIRRMIEVVIAILLLLILAPLMLITALLIRLTSRGPTLYIQTRIGKNGTPFTLYKFRSMYASKEKNPDADASNPVWTKAGDTRITPLGKLLRLTHIDEFPQLINILKNEMSFIGPRPERPEFTKSLEKEIPFYALRFMVKPGITGWAQINYRYGASVDDAYEKLQYEIYYLKHRSALLDLAIFIKTLKNFVAQER